MFPSFLKSTPVRIGLVTGSAIIVSQVLSAFVAYDLFRLDAYLTLVAITFLGAGYLLTARGTVDTGPRYDQSREIVKQLSGRELSVLRMIALGNTNKEISTTLGVGVSTVKTHVNNIYAKVGATNRKEARELWNEWSRHNLIS
jgi:DNA-binding CsgD family transcriptional regulator